VVFKSEGTSDGVHRESSAGLVLSTDVSDLHMVLRAHYRRYVRCNFQMDALVSSLREHSAIFSH
jgi:hypothetical protein